MSRIKEIAGYIPVLTILLISCCAFVPGFLQERYLNEADLLQEQIAEEETNVDRIRDQALQIFAFDANAYTIAWQELDEAIALAYEFELLASNLTAQQNATYLGLITAQIDKWNIIIEHTYSLQIEHNFTHSTSDKFVIAEKDRDGYEYEIKREDWEGIASPNNRLVLETTIGDFLSSILEEWYKIQFSTVARTKLETDNPSYLDKTFYVLVTPKAPFTFDVESNLYKLLTQPLKDSQWDLRILSYERERAIKNSNKLETAVSIITVATLLGATITSRLEEKKILHEISKVHADVKDDEALIVPKTDKLNSILLVTAVAIAVIGLLLTVAF